MQIDHHSIDPVREGGHDMRWGTRVSAVAIGAVLALAGPTAAAFAAVPANDEWTAATPITALPTTIIQDTTQATTDAVDAALNCGAPATNGSVWFRLTATQDGSVIADGTASDFSTGFFVTEGDPTAGVLLACAPGAVLFNVSAGQTYYIVAFSDTVGVPGGNLSVTFAAAPPAPTISATVDPRGTAFKDGSALVSGTYTCTGSPDFAELFGTLTQRIGRVKINGFFDVFYSPPTCDGSPQPWSAVVTSDTGLFAGGKAASVTVAFACDRFQCGDGFVEQTVQLSRGTGRR